jgi:hypothetical protein
MKKFLNFNFGELACNISIYWNKYYKLVLAVFFLIVSLWGAYSWYWYLYEFKWSSEQIDQYISSHDQEIKFKEENFRLIVNEIERRKNAYGEGAKSVKDILGPLGNPER